METYYEDNGANVGHLVDGPSDDLFQIVCLRESAERGSTGGCANASTVKEHDMVIQL